ncbi:hypothetical protein FRC04_010246 [Tulasnella sp. 424]|nr:hypothetical protein FRC04_010246 [Tulasnella sp. 424]
MPTAISNQQAQVVRYDSPTTLLDKISGALYGREKECNIMLPLIEKLQTRPSFSTSPFCVTPSAPVVDDFWLVVQTNTGEVEFVLSCTNGPLGGYPIFIWCGRPVSTMSREFIHQRMALVTQHLLKSLPSPKRVFSVFAPTQVTRAFASEWSILTGFEINQEPYYHATFSSVTAHTLLPAAPSKFELPQYSLRRATAADEAGVADLCYTFALTGDPFVLDRDAALLEATCLISQGQAYVCEVGGIIVCLVAVTRSSTNHATITKVVTHLDFGRQGWAKRLVREVCLRLLHKERKQSVLLYVALNNTPAERAYKSVGFGGLLGDAQDPNLDTEWLELGFDGTDLGHW